MKIPVILIIMAIFPLACLPQKSIEKTLEKMNNGSVDYVTVEELESAEDFLLLDARKKREFEVSHIKNAVWVGYKEFEVDSVLKNHPNKEQPIVVYCSIGVRSEDIGEKLQEAGYTNVKNLYGGIFDWKNQGRSVVDTIGNETENVHAYNKFWGKLLTKGQKVY